MSFDDYVHHIAQKYRLAVAISVIKTKPKDISMEDYLIRLQNKIKETEFDPNETVCSDDFNFDDEDVSNNKNQQNIHADPSKCDKTLLEYSMNDNDSQNSQTILRDFVFGGIEPTVERENSIGDTIRLLNEVSTDIQEKPDANQNLSQITFCESQETINNDGRYSDSNNAASNYAIKHNNYNTIQQNDNDNNNMDSQETQLYTLHGFTQNYTHVSQSQNDQFVISDKYIRNKATNSKNPEDIIRYVNGQNEDDAQMLDSASQHLFTQNDFVAVNDEKVVNGNLVYVTYHDNIDVYNASFGNAQTNQIHSEYVTKDKPFNNNHDTFVESDATIEKVINNVVKYVENGNFDNTHTFQFNLQNITDECRASQTIGNNEARIAINASINTMDDGNTISTDPYAAPITLFNSQDIEANKFTTDNNIIDNIGNRNNDNHTNCKINEKLYKETANNKYVDEDEQISEEINVVDEMELDETDSDENVQVRVPFKVLEELNRVKTYLNKKDRKNHDGYSTDSGYRSDSQARSLKSLSQLSGSWLNQSSYCLFTYIIQATETDDIVKEIAQVLGQLIDRLHEEENYPQFLEEMLETVDNTLGDITDEGSCSEDVLITKEENIQRLILLNQSKHILKHTIEKITTTLEKLHANLTQESLYELTNIVKVENSSYIFHILGIFLKKYVKVKDGSNQNTQNSQEDIFPKRSSLTELWRKKWNPNSKETIKIDDKQCVLKRCRDILNKIIVECMDGYSLVAFAALQCFNLIQV